MIADLTAQKLKYVDTQNDTNERSYILRQFCQFLRKAWLFKHGLMSEFPWRLLFGEKGALFHKMWFQPTQMRSFLLKSCTRLKNKFTTARVGGIYSLIALDYLMKDYCDESEMPPVDLGDTMKLSILTRFLEKEANIIAIDYKADHFTNSN
jgi:hypothetical protein